MSHATFDKLCKKLDGTRHRSLLPIIADSLGDLSDARQEGILWLHRNQLSPLRNNYGWYWSWSHWPAGPEGNSYWRHYLPKVVYDRLNLSEPHHGVRNSPSFSHSMLEAAQAYHGSGFTPEKPQFRILAFDGLAQHLLAGHSDYQDDFQWAGTSLCGLYQPRANSWNAQAKKFYLEHLPKNICGNCRRLAIIRQKTSVQA